MVDLFIVFRMFTRGYKTPSGNLTWHWKVSTNEGLSGGNRPSMLDLPCGHVWVRVDIDTLWIFNIAMETCPFIEDFPIKTSIYKGFSMAMLNNQILN